MLISNSFHIIPDDTDETKDLEEQRNQNKGFQGSTLGKDQEQDIEMQVKAELSRSEEQLNMIFCHITLDGYIQTCHFHHSMNRTEQQIGIQMYQAFIPDLNIDNKGGDDLRLRNLRINYLLFVVNPQIKEETKRYKVNKGNRRRLQ